MAPGRPRKQKSNGSTTSDTVAPSRSVTMKVSSPTRTPERSPRVVKRAVITAAQKQALVENLQLEVTNRARKLRQLYARLSASLRERLEIRVNRVPARLKSANILDLIEKYAENNTSTKAKSPAKRIAPEPSNLSGRPRTAPEPLSSPTRSKGAKRTSGEISTTSDDKENVEGNLNLPKKRTKTGAEGPQSSNARSTRTASRTVAPHQVLSPRSHNSRTLPRSSPKPPSSPPKVPSSPSKGTLTRPLTAMKQAASNMMEKPKPPPRTTSRQAQTGPVAVTGGSTRRGRAATTTSTTAAASGRGRKVSNGSNASDASAGTTIITRKTTTTAPAKKGVLTKKAPSSTASKRTAASKKDTTSATAGTAGRSLRSRR